MYIVPEAAQDKAPGSVFHTARTVALMWCISQSSTLTLGNQLQHALKIGFVFPGLLKPVNPQGL